MRSLRPILDEGGSVTTKEYSPTLVRGVSRAERLDMASYDNRF